MDCFSVLCIHTWSAVPRHTAFKKTLIGFVLSRSPPLLSVREPAGPELGQFRALMSLWSMGENGKVEFKIRTFNILKFYETKKNKDQCHIAHSTGVTLDVYH